ncbi:glycosyltransferase family 2 protein [Sulfurirhabdus autotrophica]|uniref:Glycosyl transferase family 2 n=1 Tax=Sulfurirhabdus autotrophica TaxID=1706046 RepID=A0A4R3XWZ0_9PROT|nr:glycosyltransferase [Sulfurirhabdus autotrophica]TCV84275.1 glycosyl transferase family 2 [Sulfurirhabdus autotrophica]
MINEAPLVSVVIPTYNRVGLLRETIGSILSQTLQDFEIIIVDNMSIDGTEDYASHLDDSRIRYFRNPNNGVIAVNRNLGIRHAKGKYLAFCDDDDLWMPEKLQRQIDVMENNVDIGLCYTNGYSFRENDVIHTRLARKRVFSEHFRHLLWENCIPSSSVLVRKVIFEETGLIDENIELVAVEDYEMWLRIAYISKLAYVDEALIKYRFHNNISSGLANIALKNVRAIKGLGEKLGINSLLILRSILHQYAKYIYFRLTGR